MNIPITVVEDNFQLAWAKMILHLVNNSGNLFNVQIHVEGDAEMNLDHHDLLIDFASNNNLIKPKQVAHTIFPYQFYKNGITREKFYKMYWRYFAYTRNCEHSGWGTYFERMIRYKGNRDDPFDQLGSIIDNLNNRDRVNGHCNIMLIPYSSEQRKTMGQPCLNYVSVQVEKDGGDKIINLLAVYRNHDFYERAYGNYLGLVKLLQYIAIETNSKIGKLTCVSSHAFFSKATNKNQLINIAKIIIGDYDAV